MRNLKWFGILAALLLILATFQTWVIIESRGLSISGVETTGTNFGKPAYLHWILCVLFIVFSIVPKVWAKRANLLVAAIHLAWTLRNYFETSACSGGECPEKQWGLYLLLISSIAMLLAVFFPDMPSESGNQKK